jgi:hypothetical protein
LWGLFAGTVRASRKESAASWYAIVLALMVGVAAIGGAAYGLGLRSSTHSQDHTQQPAKPDHRLVENPTITQWDNGYFLRFSGNLTRSGKLVRAYLEIEYSPTDRRKAAIFEKRNFVKGEPITGPIASPINPDNQLGPFRIGAADTGIAPGNFTVMLTERAKLRVILYDEEGTEIQQFGFLLLPRINAYDVQWAQQRNMNPRIQEKVPVPEIKQNNLIMITEVDWDWK